MILRAALLAAAVWLGTGCLALEPTLRSLEEACHPRLTPSQQVAAVVLWPISMWAADDPDCLC